MKLINKNSLDVRLFFGGLLLLTVGLIIGLSGTVFAADSDKAYKSFNDKLGSCPRVGQTARDECVLKVAAVFTNQYCAGKPDRAACNEDWKNGYLNWFANQPNQEALKNEIGLTTKDTSIAACNRDRTGDIPGYCTEPFNAAFCRSYKDSVAGKPDKCNIPALSSDGSVVEDPAAVDPTQSLPPPQCSAEVENENARCEVAKDCTADNLDESNCGIVRYLKLFINGLSALVGIVVVAVLVIGGIQYSTSSGDANALGAAKKRISNAILALVLFGVMYGLLQWLIPGGLF